MSSRFIIATESGCFDSFRQTRGYDFAIDFADCRSSRSYNEGVRNEYYNCGLVTCGLHSSDSRPERSDWQELDLIALPR